VFLELQKKIETETLTGNQAKSEIPAVI